MPRTGASLVEVVRDQGRNSDPTGDTAAELAENRQIRELDQSIKHYTGQVAQIEAFLDGLSDEEFMTINIFCQVEPELLLGDWPSAGHSELLKKKREILKRAVKVLSMDP